MFEDIGVEGRVQKPVIDIFAGGKISKPTTNELRESFLQIVESVEEAFDVV